MEKRLAARLGLVLAWTLLGAGCGARDEAQKVRRQPLNRLQRDWQQKTQQACLATAGVIQGLHKNTERFRTEFDEEVRKTTTGGRSMTAYNPNLFRRLSKAVAPLDVTSPKLRRALNENVWPVLDLRQHAALLFELRHRAAVPHQVQGDGAGVFQPLARTDQRRQLHPVEDPDG